MIDVVACRIAYASLVINALNVATLVWPYETYAAIDAVLRWWGRA